MPRQGHRLIVMVVVGLVLFAIVIWLAIRVATGGLLSTRPTSTCVASSGPSPSSEIPLPQRRWSSPLDLSKQVTFSRAVTNPFIVTSVVASGVPCVVMVTFAAPRAGSWFEPVSDYYLAAVDLTTMKVLWFKQDATVIGVTGGYLVINPGLGDSRALVVDQRSGQTLGEGPRALSVLVGAGHIVSLMDSAGIPASPDAVAICVGQPGNPMDCLWRTSQADGPGFFSGAGIFGDGTWLDIGSRVVDLSTGSPAPFGSDTHAYRGHVSYLGPAKDRVLRYSWDTDCAVQVWNPTSNLPIGSIIPIDGPPPCLPLDFLFDTTSPVFVVSTGNSLHGYSWRTGVEVWHVSPGPAHYYGQILDSTLLVGNVATDAQSAPLFDTPGAWGIDMTTGLAIWASQTATPLNSVSSISGHTVYVRDDSNVSAYAADSFAPLGRLALPHRFAPTGTSGWLGLVGDELIAAYGHNLYILSA